MKSDSNPPKNSADRKAVFGWVMYDWANSAFALTVLSAFFPVFLKQYWCQGVDSSISTARLGIANSVAGFCVMLLAPVLGAFADAGANRKRFLAGGMMVGVLMTALLAGVSQGAWLTALALFVFANIGFECSVLFYDSLLPQIAKPEKMDFISSLGYAVGYIGCAILFIINIAMVQHPEWFGLHSKSDAIRWSFLSAALWWLVFSIPLLLFVKEKGTACAYRLVALIATSMKQLGHTVTDIVRTPHIVLFLIAYWLYIDGVHTFIRMASDFGLSIGLPAPALMQALLLVQLIAFPSALFFGWLASRIGTLPGILIGIALYIFVSIGGPFLVTNTFQYTAFAILSAIPLGCLQALSRSYFARLIPTDKSAEYFGFYSLLGKAAVISGPLMVGIFTLASRKAGATPVVAARLGMGSIALLFVIGGILLVIAELSRKRTIKTVSADSAA
jgi:UMF1 family MFS transporter